MLRTRMRTRKTGSNSWRAGPVNLRPLRCPTVKVRMPHFAGSRTVEASRCLGSRRGPGPVQRLRPDRDARGRVVPARPTGAGPRSGGAHQDLGGGRAGPTRAHPGGVQGDTTRTMGRSCAVPRPGVSPQLTGFSVADLGFSKPRTRHHLPTHPRLRSPSRRSRSRLSEECVTRQ